MFTYINQNFLRRFAEWLNFIGYTKIPGWHKNRIMWNKWKYISNEFGNKRSHLTVLTFIERNKNVRIMDTFNEQYALQKISKDASCKPTICYFPILKNEWSLISNLAGDALNGSAHDWQLHFYGLFVQICPGSFCCIIDAFLYFILRYTWYRYSWQNSAQRLENCTVWI